MQVSYFSDVLCIWAFVSEIRLDEVRKEFGQRIEIDYRFIAVFGSTHEKVVRGWSERGGAAGYAKHVHEVADGFDHIQLHPRAWRETFPTSSIACHETLKALQLVGDATTRTRWEGRTLLEEAARRFRLAFFRDGLDISARARQESVLEELGADLAAVRARIDSGEALAALDADQHERERLRIQGSPTFVMNHGRQILYGNVGYRLIRANIEELLDAPGDRASWC